MNLETAASIGIGVLKHRQEIGAALGGLQGLGKLSGEGFAKIAEQFNLPGGLARKIGNAITEQRDPNNINAVQSMSYLHHFDANGNGQVTKEELNAGLQKLQETGLANGPAKKLYAMGDMLLKNYDKVAQLDGDAASVSYKDLGKLIRQDEKVATLSPADWQKLNA